MGLLNSNLCHVDQFYQVVMILNITEGHVTETETGHVTEFTKIGHVMKQSPVMGVFLSK